MKKLVLILSALLFLIGTTDVQAQWGKKLLKKAGESAKRATERNVEKKIDKAVDKTFDSAEDAVTGKGNDKKDNTATDVDDNTDADRQDVTQDGGQQKKKSAEMSWNKFDFVSGDEIMFEDNQANEQLGEFPSQWDVLSGSAEILSINGEKCFEIQNEGTVIPLMKDKHYLPELFTVEYDFLFRQYKVAKDNGYQGWVNAELYIEFYDANDKRCFRFSFYPYARDWGEKGGAATFNLPHPRYEWNASGESRRGEAPSIELTTEDWHRISISFNKRALKLYMDETRLFNIPNMTAPASFRIVTDEKADKLYFIKNVRIAKGAVPLYDRMLTDGKFITYGITFDVGKSTIKPESMGEINRIVTLMKENPDLKFSVEGHTDSTGNEASNQTLSEARSKAIVDKLIELGIATDRLTASGKGQSSPIADNGTDEGRAKNRRVEFVKL